MLQDKIKNIHTNEELRKAMREGVKEVADIVKSTLGPRGRNVSLPFPGGRSLITKDGVSVAMQVRLKDPLKNMWALKTIEVASKTNEDAGDGTTTATVLAQAIIEEGLKNVTAGANPMDLKKGIDKAVETITKQLETIALPVKQDSKQITQVATISANGDKQLGSLIGEAFSKIGPEGHIEVKHSKNGKTYLDFIEGYEIESGYISPLFINNFKKRSVEFSNPLIYVAAEKLKKYEDIQAVVEFALENKRPLVFIANDVENEALSLLLNNANYQRKPEERLPFVAIQAPSHGKEQAEYLQDIAMATGASVVSKDLGLAIDQVNESHLGTSDKIIIQERKTNIIKGDSDKKSIENKIEELRENLKEEKDETLQRKLKNRISKLNGLSAELNIGVYSETEYYEIRDRIEDAVKATRAASEEGVVPGGGVALVRAMKALKKLKVENQDQKTGVAIIQKAIEAPIRQIVKNGNGKPDVVIDKLLRARKWSQGYDLRNDKFVDMMEAGIIDPKKVTRVALQNAASVAGLMLTTEGALTFAEEE
jgi:chaperonin GroEL